MWWLQDVAASLQSLHPPKVVTEIRSSAPQEEERGKVIDDVLVILQTLLKRTDSLQSLGSMLGDLPGPDPWAPLETANVIISAPRGASQIFPAEEYELGEGGHHRLREFLVPFWRANFLWRERVVQVKYS